MESTMNVTYIHSPPCTAGISLSACRAGYHRDACAIMYLRFFWRDKRCSTLCHNRVLLSSSPIDATSCFAVCNCLSLAFLCLVHWFLFCVPVLYYNINDSRHVLLIICFDWLYTMFFLLDNVYCFC